LWCYGDWAGDPVCKFPGAKGNAGGKNSKPPSNPSPKPTAHFADFSGSSSDNGILLLECIITQITSRKHGHQERSCPIEGTQFEPPMTPVRGMTPQNPLEATRSSMFGQLKGKTFWEILRDHPDYFAWTLKDAKSPGASEYAPWVINALNIGGLLCIVGVG